MSEKLAYPQHAICTPEGDIYTSEDNGGCGLTKREWFAGMALQGMLARSHWIEAAFPELAEKSFKIADAMLKEGGE